MKQFLNSLGIIQPGYYDGDKFIVDFKSSDQFSVILSLFNKSDDVIEDEDAAEVTIDKSKAVYDSEKYILTLVANYSDDEYWLEVEEK